MDKLFRVALKAFIRNTDGKLLVVRASEQEPAGLRGLWDFPGGGMEYGEELQLALLREVREELGATVQIKVGKPIVVWSFIQIDSPKHCVAVGYDAEWQDGKIELSEEHDQFQWIDPNKMESLPWPVQHMPAVKQYQSIRSSL